MEKMCRQRKSFWYFINRPLKGIGCLDNKLLTAKLNAHNYNLPVLRLMHDYLPNRKKIIKIENTYST